MRDYKKDLGICDKATPGPWEWFPEIKYNVDYFEPPSGEPPSVSPPKREEDAYHRAFTVLTNEDAEFIATAREALPWYINRCVELEKRVDKMNEIFEKMSREQYLRLNESLKELEVG